MPLTPPPTDLRKLRADLDDLMTRLQPGSVFVKNLISTLVLDTTVSVSGGVPLTVGPFDRSEDLSLAVYDISATTENLEGVEYLGTDITVSGTTVALKRAFNPGPPPSQESFLVVYTIVAGPIDVKLQVRRRY